MTNQAIPQQTGKPSRDFRLLLDRMEKAPLDETGRAFVRQALTGKTFLQHLGADDLLRVASIAQQHGLISESLEVYKRCNSSYPEHKEGWQAHLATLELLRDRQGLIRVRARAAAVLSEDIVQQMPGGMADSDTPETMPVDNGKVTEPFEAMRREEENIALFLRLFRGREDAFARQWADREQERQGYVPMRRALQPDDIRDHLSGRRTYGIYLLDSNSMVHTGVIDVDLVGRLRSSEAARRNRPAIRREALYLHTRIAELAEDAGLCCIAEVSGGKGYHFWFPVQGPVPAGVMRQALQQISGTLDRDVECFSLEIFPKQDHLTGKGFGNLVKLPLGIHRGTGKPSWFIRAADRTEARQFELLRSLQPAPAEKVVQLAGQHRDGGILIHPRHAAWAEQYPELALLDTRCAMLAQIMASLRSSRTLTVREEKILLGTLGHLPRGRILLHHLFAKLPEYNRPLLDYKISRVRGTVLGCRRIHSLMEQGSGSLPCEFNGEGYPHPLRHIADFGAKDQPRSERIENMRDALENLKTAIRQVERFMGR